MGSVITAHSSCDSQEGISPGMVLWSRSQGVDVEPAHSWASRHATLEIGDLVFLSTRGGFAIGAAHLVIPREVSILSMVCLETVYVLANSQVYFEASTVG